MKALWQHLQYWGENYLVAPGFVLTLLGGTLLVNHLTGRESAEDIGALVGSLITAVQLCVVLALTGFAQHFLFGYRGNSAAPALSDDIHDSCVTAFLLSLFSAVAFGWVR